MSRFLELSVLGFAQIVALIGILIGATFVPALTREIVAAMNGQPWQASELARLIACCFGPILLGALTVFGIAWYVLSSRHLRQRMSAFPDQPWLWRADWEAKRIQLSNRAAFWSLIIATTAYLLVLFPLGVYLASLKNAWMVYGFLAVVALFLLLLIRLHWINRHRNRSILSLERLPGRIDGPFSGLVTIPVSFPKDTAFQVRLRCAETLTVHATSGSTSDPVTVLTGTQNGRHRSDSRTTTVYEDTRVVSSEGNETTEQSTCVRVQFDIPASLPSTGIVTEPTGPGQNSRATRVFHWSVCIRLVGESDLREIVFEVPVFDLSPRR
jgi:hypothetical protein